MTVYDLIKEMQTNPDFNFVGLLKSGLIPVTVVSRLHYYQTYLKFIEKGHGKTTALQLAADDCRVSSVITIYNARKFFEQEIEV